MQVLVPFDARQPKTRLGPVLDASERTAFAEAMLRDVLGAIEDAGYDPLVLATGAVDVEAPVERDERPLTPAVNDALANHTALAVVMADLPLVTAETIERVLDPNAGVVLAPGLGGGTNAFVSRTPEFRVDYHGGSYRKHRRLAEECDADVTTVDSFRLALDVDEPTDLREVLLHGDGDADRWLREAGFELGEGARGLEPRRDEPTGGGGDSGAPEG